MNPEEFASGTDALPRNIPRSIGAVFASFVVVFALSLGIDQVLHMLHVYPPWSEPMWDHRLNALALSYRLPIGVLGSYVTARLAPRNAMRHVWVGATFGFILSSLGVIASIQMKMGPAWYPILLALSVWPTAWLGGTLFLRKQPRETA